MSFCAQRACGAAKLIGGRATLNWWPDAREGLAGAGHAPNHPPDAAAESLVLAVRTGFLAAGVGLAFSSALPNRNTREYLKLCAPGIGKTSALVGTA